MSSTTKTTELLRRVAESRDIDLRTLGVLTAILIDEKDPDDITRRYLEEKYHIGEGSARRAIKLLSELGIYQRVIVGFGKYKTIINYEWGTDK